MAIGSSSNSIPEVEEAVKKMTLGNSKGKALEVEEGGAQEALEIEEGGARKLTLTSSDGESFEVEAYELLEAETIKNIIEDGCTGNTISVANVTGNILAIVIAYCKKHAGRNPHKKKEVDDLSSWDAEFINNMDLDTLYFVILAANFLNVQSLLELAAKRVVGMMKGKSPQEIREIFNIKNDFSPEEEAALEKQWGWAWR